MWLPDTSVWVDHLRRGNVNLVERLTQGSVLMHPHICGELACGNLKNRKEVLFDLGTIPSVSVATDSEALLLVEKRILWGKGLGWVDVHLLASALLSGCKLWTLDKRLEQAAQDLGVS